MSRSEQLTEGLRNQSRKVNGLRDEIRNLMHELEVKQTALTEAEHIAAGLSAELITECGFTPR